jgi:hypothetical protein
MTVYTERRQRPYKMKLPPYDLPVKRAKYHCPGDSDFEDDDDDGDDNARWPVQRALRRRGVE